MEKYLDTVAICPNQIGQHAALYGLLSLGNWVAEERAEILRRREAVEAAFRDHPAIELVSSGAYFAFLRHRFDDTSDNLARRLVSEQGILMLPGTMFAPAGDPQFRDLANGTFRAAFANAPVGTIGAFADRLASFRA